MICANKLPKRKRADEVIVNGELLHKQVEEGKLAVIKAIYKLETTEVIGLDWSWNWGMTWRRVFQQAAKGSLRSSPPGPDRRLFWRCLGPASYAQSRSWVRTLVLIICLATFPRCPAARALMCVSYSTTRWSHGSPLQVTTWQRCQRVWDCARAHGCQSGSPKCESHSPNAHRSRASWQEAYKARPIQRYLWQGAGTSSLCFSPVGMSSPCTVTP